MRFLVVEDDPMIGESLRAALRLEGHAVDWTRDGRSAEAALRAERYDLLLLDLGLPGKDGVEVLQALRARKDTMPVLVITARDAVEDRVRALDAGADDYLSKPFDLDELAARIRALGRRHAGRSEPVLEHLGVTFNPATREVARHGVPLELSAREIVVLEALLAHPGRVLSRAQLEETLYGWGEEIASNTVEVYIHRLRRKLGRHFIRNLRGLGYTVPKTL